MQIVKYRIIKIIGEQDGDRPIICNCFLCKPDEQLLKISQYMSTQYIASNNGLVENCLFECSEGIGPLSKGTAGSQKAMGQEVSPPTFLIPSLMTY
jgi:hypothetical protein